MAVEVDPLWLDGGRRQLERSGNFGHGRLCGLLMRGSQTLTIRERIGKGMQHCAYPVLLPNILRHSKTNTLG